jgi:hypothetical protein
MAERFSPLSSAVYRRLTCLLVFLLFLVDNTYAWEGSVANLRPVLVDSQHLAASGNAPCRFYRAATLDGLSVADARGLLEGSALPMSAAAAAAATHWGRRRVPVQAVIDLRNSDEIQKGMRCRTDGAQLFYASLETVRWNKDEDDMNRSNSSNDKHNNNTLRRPRLYHLPLLADVDSFWEEAISRMDRTTRFQATLQTVVSGGALDRAAARTLERGGCGALYTVLLASAPREMARVLHVCTQEVARIQRLESLCANDDDNDNEEGVILFHCQKGKDRTGLVAMLLQACLGASEDRMVHDYSQSEYLLGGDPKEQKDISGRGGLVDWSHFRGSPPEAMVTTLEWIRQRYGSIDGYLDHAKFGPEQRKRLQNVALGARVDRSDPTLSR